MTARQKINQTMTIFAEAIVDFGRNLMKEIQKKLALQNK